MYPGLFLRYNSVGELSCPFNVLVLLKTFAL